MNVCVCVWLNCMYPTHDVFNTVRVYTCMPTCIHLCIHVAHTSCLNTADVCNVGVHVCHLWWIGKSMRVNECVYWKDEWICGMHMAACVCVCVRVYARICASVHILCTSQKLMVMYVNICVCVTHTCVVCRTVYVFMYCVCDCVFMYCMYSCIVCVCVFLWEILNEEWLFVWKTS